MRGSYASAILKFKSSAFKNYESIPIEYTCQGKDLIPPLIITSVPSRTKSLVLIVHDPDAPLGDWTHWLLWNIPPKTNYIDVDYIPNFSISGKNSFGQIGYGAPCPPPGKVHHYLFDLYALNNILNLPTTTTRQTLEQIMQSYIITKTSLIGLYTMRRN